MKREGRAESYCFSSSFYCPSAGDWVTVWVASQACGTGLASFPPGPETLVTHLNLFIPPFPSCKVKTLEPGGEIVSTMAEV